MFLYQLQSMAAERAAGLRCEAAAAARAARARGPRAVGRSGFSAFRVPGRVVRRAAHS